MDFASLPVEILEKIAMGVIAKSASWRLAAANVVNMTLVCVPWKGAIQENERVWSEELAFYFDSIGGRATPLDWEGVNTVYKVLSIGKYVTRSYIHLLGGQHIVPHISRAVSHNWFHDSEVTVFETFDVVSHMLSTEYNTEFFEKYPLTRHESDPDLQAQDYLIFIERFLENRGVLSEAVRENAVSFMFANIRSLRMRLKPYLGRLVTAAAIVRSSGIDPDTNGCALNMFAAGMYDADALVRSFRTALAGSVTTRATHRAFFAAAKIDDDLDE